MDFRRRVLLACRMIPLGKVATYGQIALLCGMPRHARQVGYVLGHLPPDAGAPAHRVVNHKGFLSGAASFGKPDTQKKRLKAEGVSVSMDGYVNLKKDGWVNTLDDALLLRSRFRDEGV